VIKRTILKIDRDPGHALKFLGIVKGREIEGTSILTEKGIIIEVLFGLKLQWMNVNKER
jgi:hypothetical protein